MVNILDAAWDWCAQKGVQDAFKILKSVVDIIRYVVPIGLIIMTSFDIAKKVINPDDKDGQKKIMIRAIAALIVFFIPVFIKIVFWLVDVGEGKGKDSYENSKSGIRGCLNAAGWNL